MIKNKINGKKYIGQAVCYIETKIKGKVYWKKNGAEERWKKHVWSAKRNEQRCRALNNAILKYGEHNFDVKTIHLCDIVQLNYFEAKFVRQYNTLCPNGYNIRNGGGSRGKLSETSRALISAAKSGEKNHMWGKHHSDESKKKISKSNTGKVRSLEYRKNMSNSKGRNDKNDGLPMYIYRVTQRNSEGYVVKYHPLMKQQKRSFTAQCLSMEEKLKAAKEYIKELEK